MKKIFPKPEVAQCECLNVFLTPRAEGRSEEVKGIWFKDFCDGAYVCAAEGEKRVLDFGEESLLCVWGC